MSAFSRFDRVVLVKSVCVGDECFPPGTVGTLVGDYSDGKSWVVAIDGEDGRFVRVREIDIAPAGRS
jgi:hypothetical protein